MWRWTYTRYSRVANEEQKKKVLGVYICNFKPDTRYSEIADKDQKKVLGGDNHFKLSNRGELEKIMVNPALD